MMDNGQTEQINARLNEVAKKYFQELSISTSENPDNALYKTRTALFEEIYCSILFFYCKSLGSRGRSAILSEGINVLNLYSKSLNYEELDRINDVYSGFLSQIDNINFDSEQAFSNYLHSSVAPRIKGSFERFISDEDLQSVAKLEAEIKIADETYEEETQRNKSERLWETWHELYPEYKRSKSFFQDYLRGNTGTLSLDIPVGEEGDTSLGDMLPEQSSGTSMEDQLDLNDFLENEENIFEIVREIYLRGRRKGKINTEEFFDIQRRNILLESGLGLASPEEMDISAESQQKILAERYKVSEAAISQEMEKYRLAWGEAFKVFRNKGIF